MKRLIYFMCLCLLFTLNANAQDNNQQMFIDTLNHFRIENGLNPVKYCQELTDLARKHSKFLITYSKVVNYEFIYVRQHSSHNFVENINLMFFQNIRNWEKYVVVPHNDFKEWRKSKDGHNENMLTENVTYVGYAYETKILTDNGNNYQHTYSVLLLK